MLLLPIHAVKLVGRAGGDAEVVGEDLLVGPAVFVGEDDRADLRKPHAVAVPQHRKRHRIAALAGNDKGIGNDHAYMRGLSRNGKARRLSLSRKGDRSFRQA